MADKEKNIYTELFESLTIPSRLEPENIAAMLNERVGAKSAHAEKVPAKTYEDTKPVAEVSDERRISVSSGGRHRTSSLYRTAAAMAACAALALGVAGYIGLGESSLPSDAPNDGGAYASDYRDVHKTFEQYYVDTSGKKTLDSAIKDIEHSYNENDNDSYITPSTEPSQTDAPDVSEPPISSDVTEPTAPSNPPEDNPPEPQTPGPAPSETVDDSVPLPENGAVYDNSDIVFGDGFILRKDQNTVRIISTAGGALEYTGNIFPIFEELTAKTLEGLYTDGRKVAAVYSVVRGGASYPAQDQVNGFIDGLYGASMPSASHNSVEVCIYEIQDGYPYLTSTVVQSGSFVDMNCINGSLYLITDYNDYRVAPIIGVDDLESYVPSYTVNGVKYYVEASDIMIPDYISTTDYTVISGISFNGGVSMKAVLSCEGRVVLRNGAVYLFGYDSSDGADRTSVRVFSLSGGSVTYAGCVYIGGVALGGDGISCFGNTIAVTTVELVNDTYVTNVGVYDTTMNIISRAMIPGALTTAERIGNTLYLSGAQRRYGIDLSEPSVPQEVSGEHVANPAEGLVEFDGGYVTLTKASDGSIQLAKIIKNSSGELRLEYKTTVIADASSTSKALENNGLLFVSGNIVGLPYGYFDGYDYCYRYALYCAENGGFIPMGEIEFHETDDVYENEKAILNGGVLYIFSEGRISSAVVGNSLTLISSAEIVESAYSGH